MIFEVWRDGERKFYTEDKKCIPSERMQADLKKCGYKLKWKDDKNAKKTKDKKMNTTYARYVGRGSISDS